MKIAMLWPGLSGYINACLRELTARTNIDLLVAYWAPISDAPYDDSEFRWIPKAIHLAPSPDPRELLREVEAFRPDVMLVSSWHIPAFRYVLRHIHPKPLRVLCMDNQWLGTLKQHAGVLSSRWYLHSHYDAVFVPGERQASFARRLGFRPDRIWRGLYCPDYEAFAGATSDEARSRVFAYLGRLSPEKGITDLLDAYEIYRSTTAEPWSLIVTGAGPLIGELSGRSGVTYRPFVQPRDLPRWLARVGCLVVPSRFEPWGVVIAEAAASGMPIVATEACGAGPHLIHDFVNGRIAQTSSPVSIAECLHYVSSATDEQRAAMGTISRNLASVYTPRRWADTVLGLSSRQMAAQPER